MITTFLFLCCPLTLCTTFLPCLRTQSWCSAAVMHRNGLRVESSPCVWFLHRWSWPICLRRNRTAEHPSPVNINEDHTTIDFYWSFQSFLLCLLLLFPPSSSCRCVHHFLSLERVHHCNWHHHPPLHSTIMASVISADVDPAHLANYPALLPPHGLIPNFVDPYTRGPVIIIVDSILIALMMIFVVVRIYIKTCINRKVHWDDCQAPVELQLLTTC